MRRIISERGMPSAAAASRSVFGTSLSMSSVVRTTTGMTITASASAPAKPRSAPIGTTIALVDEQTDDDRRRAEQDVVDEAHDAGEPVVLAVFGQ